MASIQEATYSLKTSTIGAKLTGGASALKDVGIGFTGPGEVGGVPLPIALFFGRLAPNKTSLFLIFPVQVPPRSVVTKAKLTLTPGVTEATAPFNCRLGIVMPDARWNKVVSAYDTITDLHGVPGVRLRNAGLGTMAYSWGTQKSSNQLDPGRGYDAVGASMLASSSGTLTNATINMHSIPQESPPSQMWCEVWSTVESPAGVWRPLAKLAESVRILHEDLPTGGLPEVQFDFQGANQISISSGTRYHCRIRTTQVGSVNLVNIALDTELATADKRGFGYGYADGFTPNIYSSQSGFPHPTVDGSDAIIGGKLFADVFIATFAVGAFTVNVPKTYGSAAYSPSVAFDLHTPLQAYFASSSYVQGLLCLVVDPLEALTTVKLIHGPDVAAFQPLLTIAWEVEGVPDWEPVTQEAVDATAQTQGAVIFDVKTKRGVSASGSTR